MTPKNKAKELLSLFTFNCRECDYDSNAKQSCLNLIYEIKIELDDNFDSLYCSDRKQYWEEVKQEIEKL
jgi:hypothetical protein